MVAVVSRRSVSFPEPLQPYCHHEGRLAENLVKSATAPMPKPLEFRTNPQLHACQPPGFLLHFNYLRAEFTILLQVKAPFLLQSLVLTR